MKLQVLQQHDRLAVRDLATPAATLEAIGKVRADLYLMGVSSVHPKAGLSTGDFEEACVKCALCHAAAETIVLASPEKLGTASPYQIVELNEIGGIVALASTPAGLIAPYITIYPA